MQDDSRSSRSERTGARSPRGRAAALLAVGVFTAGLALGGPASGSPYAPFQFLVGEWSIQPESGGSEMGVARFRWGPNGSYIWCASSFLVGGTERPHFEGLLLWNGANKNLDFLIVMDLERGLVQERGVVSVAADGTVIRDITATYSEGTQPIGGPVAGREGATARFRQTYKSVGPDEVLTQVLRDTGKGWVATFPGSDHLRMVRRSPRRAS